MVLVRQKQKTKQALGHVIDPVNVIEVFNTE